MNLLQVENLEVAFRGQPPVVKGISFSLKKGEMLALVGESGSGKSVSALAIMQLHDPQNVYYPAGSIQFQGHELLGESEASLQRRRGNDMAMIFQEPMSALNPLHTIGKQIAEMIRYHQPLSESEIQARMQELLGLVGLDKLKTRLDSYPHQLSGGERQRVMIAIALANNPDLLIADEPTTALDVTLQAQIIALLKDLQKRLGLAILLITHDLTLVRHAADHVAIMREGEIIEQGDTLSVFDNPKHPYTQHLLASEPSGEAVTLPSLPHCLLRADSVSVSFAGTRRLFSPNTPDHVALLPTSLNVQRGETLGIVGESGSGKTTLGLALLRLIQSKGDIFYEEQNISLLTTQQLQPLRRRLQFVFQDPFASLNPRMSIGDIVSEGLLVHEPSLSHRDRKARVIDILREVGLEAEMRNRYPHEFSGGQRQRINIARAMILQPDLVVLDEPTSALDLSLQAQIITLLKEMQRRRGTSYLFISHDLRVLRAIAHRLIVMKQGAIVETGSCGDILTHPKHPYTQELIQSAFLHENGRNPAGGAL
ncbi:MAG: dipeptide ABC transporter ATP-binding protein [Rickettsiales bacterium]|nr:dipeptide ABC transporter ATP-binding protein [Rickettsiales bacterium]